MGNLTENFSKEEFVCKCGCGLYNMDVGVIARMQMAREYAGIPLKINSGSRCIAHNADEGGSETSSHLLGLAVDITVNSDATRWILLDALKQAGFRRIGIGKTFLHVDYDLEKPAPRLWPY